MTVPHHQSVLGYCVFQICARILLLVQCFKKNQERCVFMSGQPQHGTTMAAYRDLLFFNVPKHLCGVFTFVFDSARLPNFKMNH